MHSPSYNPRWPRKKTYSIIVGLAIASILLIFAYRSPSISLRGIVSTSSDDPYSPHAKATYTKPTHLSSSKTSTQNPSSSSVFDIPAGLYELIEPHFHSITAQNFTSRTGKVFQLPKAARFTKPLGKQILIMDVESRDISGPGGLLDNSAPKTGDMQGLTLGRLNHYMFAMLHGYDYQLVQLPEDPTLHGTWNKVPAMREAIKHYEYVVFLDGDAIFTHLHLPLEWLLNYWGITNDTTMALAEDPNDPFFLNVKKLNINLNTGFVIAHQTPKSEEFFDAWMTCPDEHRYPGCAMWKLTHTHEQAVVNEYLRYDYPEQLHILPCNEANRYMNSGDCEGEFIGHYWPYKEELPGGVKEVMDQYFWPPLQKGYSHDRDHIVKSMKGPKDP